MWNFDLKKESAVAQLKRVVGRIVLIWLTPIVPSKTPFISDYYQVVMGSDQKRESSINMISHFTICVKCEMCE